MNGVSILGGIIFLIGIFLFIGNVTGCAGTFPMAGFITITIGSLILKASKD
jgi:hypothetical protein